MQGDSKLHCQNNTLNIFKNKNTHIFYFEWLKWSFKGDIKKNSFLFLENY